MSGNKNLTNLNSISVATPPGIQNTDLFYIVRPGAVPLDLRGAGTDVTTFVALSFVPKTTKVNGHALSGDITVNADDLGVGELPLGVEAVTPSIFHKSNQVANATYVVSNCYGYAINTSVRFILMGSPLPATYSNGSSGVGATLTNSGAQAALVIGSIPAVVNDLVLLGDQDDSDSDLAIQNGVYIVTNIGSGSTNWVLTRSTLFDTPAKINNTSLIFGNADYSDRPNLLVYTDPSILPVTDIGTDPIEFGINHNLNGFVPRDNFASAGQIILGNSDGIANPATMTGDVTIDDAGVTTIGAGVVTNSKLAGSITANKLQSTPTDLGNADVTVDLSNSHAAHVTNLITDGTITAGTFAGAGTSLTGTASGLTAGFASAVAVGGITGLGTGVATALAINIGSAGAPVLFNGAGGTPSSMVGTNITGTASGLTAGNVTTNANLTGPITSVGNAVAAIAAHGVVIGNGSSALNTVAPGTSGNVLASNGTDWISETLSALGIVQRLYSNTAVAGNAADSTEDTLLTFTLPANTLAANGDKIRIQASFVCAANSHTKTMKLYFGSATPFSFSGSENNFSAFMEMLVMRTASGVQIINGTAANSTTNSNTGFLGYVTNIAGSETDSAGIVIKVTGQSGSSAANDVVCNQLTVEFIPH